jgi:hypothetical protein
MHHFSQEAIKGPQVNGGAPHNPQSAFALSDAQFDGPASPSDFRNRFQRSLIGPPGGFRPTADNASTGTTSTSTSAAPAGGMAEEDAMQSQVNAAQAIANAVRDVNANGDNGQLFSV